MATLTNTWGTKIELVSEAVPRTARKKWLCQCPGNGHQNCPHTIECNQTIRPGERYIEYLGEAAPYASGTRYCLPCGELTWEAS